MYAIFLGGHTDRTFSRMVSGRILIPSILCGSTPRVKAGLPASPVVRLPSP